MLDNLAQIFKLAAYMGFIESIGIVFLAYQHNGYVIVYYALTLFFWSPSFIVMTFTKARKLNVYYPNPGLMNPEVMYTLLVNFVVSVFVIYLFYMWIYFRVEHKDSSLIM